MSTHRIVRPLQYPAAPLALSITGVPTTFVVGAPYSFRFSLANPIGKAAVVSITGATLPAKYQLYVDNVASQVVLSWPGSAVAENDLVGGNFDVSGPQEYGPGWTISSDNVLSAPSAAKFLNFTGTSDIVWPVLDVPGPSGTSVTMSCSVNQGASAKRAVEAGVGIRWVLPSGDPIEVFGNVVDSSVVGPYGTSTLTSTKPHANARAIPFVRATRRRENKPLYVDNVQWSVTSSGGTVAVDGIPLSFTVQDSLGRTASWSGTIAGRFSNSATLLLYTAAGSPFSSVSLTGGSFPAGNALPTAVGASALVSNAGVLYTLSSGNLRSSTNLGVSWSAPTTLANATTAVLCVSGGFLLAPVSTGVARLALPSTTWTPVALSMSVTRLVANGTRVLAYDATNRPVFSTDSGATWGTIGGRLDSTAASFGIGSGSAIAPLASGAFVLAGQIWGGPYGLSSFIPGIAVSAASGTGTAFTYFPVVVLGGGAQSVIVADIDGVENLFVGTVNGRVYRSSNGGVSWSLVYTFTNPTAVVSLSFDGQTVLAATSTVIVSSTTGTAWSVVTAPGTSYSGLHTIKG